MIHKGIKSGEADTQNSTGVFSRPNSGSFWVCWKIPRPFIDYTSGFDPGTGKQIQHTINGKSKKEVARKLREATSQIDKGTYLRPTKMTVGEWPDIWAKEYLVGVKEGTSYTYRAAIKNHIKPALGAIRLQELNPHTIQSFSKSGLKQRKRVKTRRF